jgi:hypothetical protein
MANEHEHDDAIDKVLAALSKADPPEGMNARIAQRLQHRAAAPPAVFIWRDIFAGSTLAGAWCRGALTGTAVATLAACALLLIQHHSQSAPNHQQVIASDGATIGNAATNIVPPPAISVSESRTKPCASPTVMRVHSVVATPQIETLRAESRAPSRPAPELALTAQERELVRLARTADPKQLAILNPETQARLDAEEAAEFEKFFTPPPPPKPIGDNE